MTDEQAANRAEVALNIINTWEIAPDSATEYLYNKLYSVIEKSKDPAKVRSYFPDNDDVVIKQDLMLADLTEQGITPANTF